MLVLFPDISETNGGNCKEMMLQKHVLDKTEIPYETLLTHS